MVPKGRYVSWDDFSAKASDAEIGGFIRAVGEVARAKGLVEPVLPVDGQYRRAMADRKCRTCTSISSAVSLLGRMICR